VSTTLNAAWPRDPVAMSGVGLVMGIV